MNNNIAIQKITPPYVNDECIQIMIPKRPNKPITIINSDGVILNYSEKTKKLINQYISDPRKEIFPYGNIPMHYEKACSQKIEYYNELFDYDRIYIEIIDDYILEKYAIKDDQNSFIITEMLAPDNETIGTQKMTKEELVSYLESATNGIYKSDNTLIFDEQKKKQDIENIFSDQKIIAQYKEKLTNLLKRARQGSDYYENIKRTINSDLTIEDIPYNETIINDILLVFTNNNEISEIKLIAIMVSGKDLFEVKTLEVYHPSGYTLDEARNLKKTNYIPMKKVSVSRRLNKNVNPEEIKKAKKLALVKNKKRSQ